MVALLVGELQEYLLAFGILEAFAVLLEEPVGAALTADANHQRLLIVDAPPLPQPVYVDRDMWEKVLVNLISNAFKFTHTGQVSVAVAPSADGQAVEVRVADTGIGIPAEHLSKLFERFHRVEGAQGRSFEGTGIGLALVQELVKLHGGDIAVDSRPGQGTTFTVRLQIGRAHV